MGRSCCGLTPKNGNAIDSIDPAVSLYTYVGPLLRMTGDSLTAFTQVGGLPGTRPVPDLATSLPAPTDGGRTYTFQLRPGIRYSNGRPVQAADFRSTFERFYALRSPVTEYDGIVGGAQCRTHPRCDLSRGIVADDVAHTVTFHLTGRTPTFSTSSRSRPPTCCRATRRGGRPERTRCPRPAPT